MPPATLRELLCEIVDYAGLFPPAQLTMADAVGNYAEYLKGPHAWMLGRFVVPAARLDEFDRAAARLLPRGAGSQPWRLSALVGEEVRGDAERMLEFNGSHAAGSAAGHAVIDVAELKVGDPADVARTRAELPRPFMAYCEFPLALEPEPFVATAAQQEDRVGLKARTGGVTPDAFPPAEQLIRFIEACVTARVPFKVTAGLHHPVRGEYPLTYEPDSPCGTMFGYLNVFIAAAVLVAGGSAAEAAEVLGEDSLAMIQFGDDEASWGTHTLSLDVLRATRRLAGAFGSCSFREPVDELIGAGVLE